MLVGYCTVVCLVCLVVVEYCLLSSRYVKYCRKPVENSASSTVSSVSTYDWMEMIRMETYDWMEMIRMEEQAPDGRKRSMQSSG